MMIMTKLGAFCGRPLCRYVLIGGSVYVFEIIVILIVQHMGGSAVLAVGLGFWLGLIASFSLQKIVTFSDKRMHHRVLIPQITAFSLLVLFNFGFTLLVAKLFENIMPAVLTRTIALGMTTVWNFYLYKTRIFRTDENPVY